ncbi:MAG: hypothetical protein IJA86_09690, partial [Clostridia bacterium]|nr:hypothetical protein [Clostridia bacterium]
MKKNRKIYILLLLLMALVGGVLIYAGYSYTQNGGSISFGGILRTDHLYMILIFLIMLPILLLALFLVLLFAGKDSSKEAVAYVPPASESEKEEEKEKDKENGTGERFCMLSEIDRNSGKYGRMFYEKGVTLESFC